MILSGKPELEPNDVVYRTWLKGIRNGKQDDKKRRVEDVVKTMKIHNFRPATETLDVVKTIAGGVDTSGLQPL